MNCDNTKKFCEQFNEFQDEYINCDEEKCSEIENFMDVWKLQLAEALILDFGNENIVAIGKIAEGNI